MSTPVFVACGSSCRHSPSVAADPAAAKTDATPCEDGDDEGEEPEPVRVAKEDSEDDDVDLLEAVR